MTSKISYRKLFCFEAKRNGYLTGLGMFGIFMTFPFLFIRQIVTFAANNRVSFRHGTGELLAAQSEGLYQVTYKNFALPILLLFLAVFNGIVLFSYLFSRKKQDFYFGQPVKRARLFGMSYIQGLLNMVIPFGFNLLLVIALTASNHCLSKKLAVILLQMTLTQFLFYAAVFTFTILACVLAGKLFNAILGTMLILMYPPLFQTVICFIYKGRMMDLAGFLNKIEFLSPIDVCMAIYLNYVTKLEYLEKPSLMVLPYPWIQIITLLVLIAVGLTLAIWLYLRRPAEGAGKPVASKYSKVVIKGFLVVLFTMSCAVMIPYAKQIHNSAVSIEIGVIAFFIGTFIIDTILELDWKAFIKNRKYLWVYAAVTLTVYIGLCYSKEVHRYNGFEHLPENYTAAEAVKDGCVVFGAKKDLTKKNCTLEDRYCKELYEHIEGESMLAKFAVDVSFHRNSKVRLVFSQDEDNPYCDLVYQNGMIKKYTKDSLYDGNTGYPYIKRFTGHFFDGYPDKIMYIFTDKKDLTFQEIKEYYYNDGAEPDCNYEFLCTVNMES